MDGIWTPMRFADNGGVKLAYDRWGGAEGEPLLMIMGLGVTRHWWPDGLCTAFAARGFAVARYDQRDAGDSTRLPPAPVGNPVKALFRKKGEAYTAEDMADDAVAVMDALGWPSAHLFGHSMGGAVAQRVALRHPSRVRTLTTSASVPCDAAGLGTLRYVRLGTLAKFTRLGFPDTPAGQEEAAVAVARLLASPDYPLDEEQVRAAARRGSSGVQDNQAQSRQIGAQWSGPPLTEMRTPTLVLHGDRDPLIRPSAARAVAAAVPGAKLVLQPGVGHDLPAPVWDTLADHVRALADGKTA
ncbi:alpha/beta hydrolase [Actinocorallia aurantiaca]|uniref:Alpha/beta hydrolase n=1 Tax=Actinocorallia aurantiaca TaxID=46204 RepID=A0ABN3USE4_9ACTN